jgi:predicted acyltransferase
MGRLTSLDVFRGITIAAMILVNMASLADKNVYPPLLHAIGTAAHQLT